MMPSLSAPMQLFLSSVGVHAFTVTSPDFLTIKVLERSEFGNCFRTMSGENR